MEKAKKAETTTYWNYKLDVQKGTNTQRTASLMNSSGDGGAGDHDEEVQRMVFAVQSESH